MNRLPVRVVSVEEDGGVLLIESECAGRIFVSTLVGLPGASPPVRVGQAAEVWFKETEAALAKGLSGLLSLRNRHPAVVRGVVSERLLARVELDFLGRSVISVITARSVQRLAIRPGDEVEWLVKANEMLIRPLEEGAAAEERGGGEGAG